MIYPKIHLENKMNWEYKWIKMKSFYLMIYIIVVRREEQGEAAAEKIPIYEDKYHLKLLVTSPDTEAGWPLADRWSEFSLNFLRIFTEISAYKTSTTYWWRHSYEFESNEHVLSVNVCLLKCNDDRYLNGGEPYVTRVFTQISHTFRPEAVHCSRYGLSSGRG